MPHERRIGLFRAALRAMGALCAASALCLSLSLAAGSRHAAEASKAALPAAYAQAVEERAAPAGALPGASAADASEADDFAGEYLGVLSIPSLSLELPVARELDGAALRDTPCRYRGSADTGDLIIAAHSYRRHFGRLAELEPGSELVLTTAGRELTYRLSATETIGAYDSDALLSGDWELTLFTCTPGGTARLAARFALDGDFEP